MKEISVTAKLSDIMIGDCRLDATYYDPAVYLAKQYLNDYEEKGNKVIRLGDLSQGTFNPPPVKRVFTDDVNKGTPYLLPQEMFDFYWEPRKFVLAHKMNKIEDWFLKHSWVVITQSGSVGKPYYVTEKDEELVMSQNAIRIPPKNKEDGGYIYAYLSTWIGQTLLKKDEFGITVKHIRPNQVDQISIPVISKKKVEVINDKVKEAFELRKKAISLLNEAKQIIYDELDAPYTMIGFDIDEESV